MNRFIALALVSASLVACADQTTTPVSSVRPSDASFDAGNPPPPPITGSGSFDLEVGNFFEASIRGAASTSSGPCSAFTSSSMSYQYLLNKPGNNAFLHIDPDDPSKHVTIHQTNNKLDAHGTIVGTDFSFTIADAIGGAIIDLQERVPGYAFVQLTGTLKTPAGSCKTTATLNVRLSGNEN